MTNMKDIKKDILIIDDDNDLAMITNDVLSDHGYSVQISNSAEESYDVLAETSFRLIILDINLPGDSGFKFCSELRKNSTIPIIFVSARTSETDRITGLDLGADDYLPKPYSLQELLSRVNANMRRAYGFSSSTVFSFGNIEIDMTSRSVKKNGQVVKLSIKEFDLLKYFIDHKNTVLKKEMIFSDVWGMYNDAEISSLSVHVRWLREKLENDASKPEYLKTVWGVGYIFEVKQ